MGNKVFIIQLMSGRSDEEVLDERKAVERQLREWGYEPIESYVEEDAPEGVCIPVWYLARSIEKLSEADYIYLIDGWEKGRGCKIERDIAEAYGIPEV